MIQGKLQDYEKIVETCFIYSLTSHIQQVRKKMTARTSIIIKWYTKYAIRSPSYLKK